MHALVFYNLLHAAQSEKSINKELMSWKKVTTINLDYIFKEGDPLETLVGKKKKESLLLDGA